MRGAIHVELKRYVITKLGTEAWADLLEIAGFPNKDYLTVETYPDQETFALVSAACHLTGLDVSVVLKDFGKFLAPNLIAMYQALLPPHWRTKELLMNVEDTIHKVVRASDPNAFPPKLRFIEAGENTLEFFYGSPRNMPDLAVGIMMGVATYYNETISIEDLSKDIGMVHMRVTIQPSLNPICGNPSTQSDSTTAPASISEKID